MVRTAVISLSDIQLAGIQASLARVTLGASQEDGENRRLTLDLRAAGSTTMRHYASATRYGADWEGRAYVMGLQELKRVLEAG